MYREKFEKALSLVEELRISEDHLLSIEVDWNGCTRVSLVDGLSVAALTSGREFHGYESRERAQVLGENCRPGNLYHETGLIDGVLFSSWTNQPLHKPAQEVAS